MVLPDVSAPASYTDEFLLPPGVTARDADDGVEFVDRAERVIGAFGGGFAFDAGFPLNGAVPTQASVRLLGQNGSVASVEVSIADPEWLTAPGRVFPVTIDPFWTDPTSPGPGGGAAMVIDGSEANNAFYNPPLSLAVGRYFTGHHYRTYLNFDMSGVPAGSTVTYAQIAMFNGYTGSTGSPPYTDCTGKTVRVDDLAAPFNAGTTWNNQPPIRAGTTVVSPAFAHQPNGSSPSDCPPAWVGLPATPIAQAWVNGMPNYGVRVSSSDENNSAWFQHFWAPNYGNGAYPPQIQVWWDRPPSPPTDLFVTGNSGGSATVNWTLGSTNGGSPLVHHVVYAINADGTYADNYAVACATCRTATLTNLVAGRSYSFWVIPVNQSNLYSVAVSSPVMIPLAAAGARNGPAISGDGMYVAFSSRASDLVSGDANGVDDVFIFDRDAGATSLVSVGPGDSQANGHSRSVSMSADARHVAFESAATNLVANDSNGVNDVFVRDLVAGTTTLVSVNTSGQVGNAVSYGSAISADGQHVAFASAASDLVPGDTNGNVDVFVRDLAAGTTTRVSLGASGTQGNAGSSDPAVSADGRYVAFSSAASNLVSEDTNAVDDVFIRDRVAGTTARMSVGAGGAQGNGASASPAISSDGRNVAFSSAASNLVIVDTNEVEDVFLRDRTEATTARVSVAESASPANGPSVSPSVSPDGRYVAFESEADNLVNADSNGVADIFEVDVMTSRTSRLSIDDVLGQGNATSLRPAVSSDGTFTAFESNASNFDDDSNNALDVYLHVWTDLTPAITGPSFAAAASSTGTGCGGQPTATTAMAEGSATADATSPRNNCVVVQISQSKSTAQSRAAADAPIGPQNNCDDGDVYVGRYPVNISTNGLSPEAIAAIRTYARRANSWLAKASRVAPEGAVKLIRIKGTKGALRIDASRLAQVERDRALQAGTPYSGQVGHVPDTAVTGQANPPCRWLDMPGTTNQRAGAPLGRRVGKFITHYLVGGALP